MICKVIKRINCLLYGHRWRYTGTAPNGGRVRRCLHCNRRQIGFKMPDSPLRKWFAWR